MLVGSKIFIAGVILIWYRVHAIKLDDPPEVTSYATVLIKLKWIVGLKTVVSREQLLPQ